MIVHLCRYALSAFLIVFGAGLLIGLLIAVNELRMATDEIHGLREDLERLADKLGQYR